MGEILERERESLAKLPAYKQRQRVAELQADRAMVCEPGRFSTGERIVDGRGRVYVKQANGSLRRA